MVGLVKMLPGMTLEDLRRPRRQVQSKEATATSEEPAATAPISPPS
jgi:hypothetical protein